MVGIGEIPACAGIWIPASVLASTGANDYAGMTEGGYGLVGRHWAANACASASWSGVRVSLFIIALFI